MGGPGQGGGGGEGDERGTVVRRDRKQRSCCLNAPGNEDLHVVNGRKGREGKATVFMRREGVRRLGQNERESPRRV